MTAERTTRRTHTAAELAKKLGCNPRTVRRYMALPREQYLASSLTRAKPWEAMGMSRATWYRKGKPEPEQLEHPAPQDAKEIA